MPDSTRDGRPITVVDDPEQSAFTATVDGEVAGRAVYRLRGAAVVFTHTETEPSMQHQGIGNALAGRALDLVAASGRKVVPRCPFIASYIQGHPEYADLVERMGT